jgi:hypothetical protein
MDAFRPAVGDLDVLVSVAEDHLDRLGEVVEHLQAAGLRVAETMEHLGVVAGTIAARRMAGLRGVEGVDAVEPNRPYQLPPPASDVQ